ncbi:MAG: cellulase family glycosylhydrolase [Candidatus Hinthialibacter antarcticus]|nr:cellulase family glycosylhydrolase [Candidatus Hinthialibacter antarcticus]
MSFHVFKILLTALILIHCASIYANEKLDYWNQQRKGANGMDWYEPETWMKAASETGIEVVRISPASWPSDSRDPLLGNADEYTALDQNDLAKLIQVLDYADQYGVKVVITMFSLPGVRWSQHNDDKFDYRLWHDDKYLKQACAFWQDMAKALKDHRAVVGYNPLNEPHPAREYQFEDNRDGLFELWYKTHKDTTADLNRFNRTMIKAIREIDAYTPIVLDGWFHAVPKGIEFVEPIDDKALIYSFHVYEPWIFTTLRVNKERFSYPDAMPAEDGESTEAWEIKNLTNRIQPVVDWAKKHNIPANRIWASEFGCDRRVKGAQQYFTDLISILNKNDWHWAFYSYRAVDWDGMDYELGTEKMGWKYWEAIEAGKHPESLKTREDNPLWNVIQRELK